MSSSSLGGDNHTRTHTRARSSHATCKLRLPLSGDARCQIDLGGGISPQLSLKTTQCQSLPTIGDICEETTQHATSDSGLLHQVSSFCAVQKLCLDLAVGRKDGASACTKKLDRTQQQAPSNLTCLAHVSRNGVASPARCLHDMSCRHP